MRATANAKIAFRLRFVYSGGEIIVLSGAGRQVRQGGQCHCRSGKKRVFPALSFGVTEK